MVGFLSDVRSWCMLCAEVHLNPGCRRFCRLGLDGAAPDHAPFSRNRHSHSRDAGVFRAVSENVVRRCAEAGLVPGDEAWMLELGRPEHTRLG